MMTPNDNKDIAKDIGEVVPIQVPLSDAYSDDPCDDVDYVVKPNVNKEIEPDG